MKIELLPHQRLTLVRFLLCGFSPWSAIEILFKEMR